MVVDFVNMNLNERPTLILKTAGGTPLGVLGFAKNVTFDLKYNEVSTIEFEVPAYADGIEVPFYDDLVGMRIIEAVGIGQFTLVHPKETGNGVTRMKTCEANSLEYEFANKKITIPNGTYRFYFGEQNEDTILGMILELMPSWSVGTVSEALYNKYRTFDETNENVYNFMKGAVQESFNCIFDFDTMNRTINVRSASETPDSKPVFLSTENLAKEIEVEENTGDVVTRLDVNGAEGVDIRDVNPTGTNKIIMLDYYMTTDNFSQSLIDKYYAWKALCESKRSTYYNLSIRYTLAVMQRTAEEAKLGDLKNELTNLENVLSVTFQAVSQGIETQAAITQAKNNIAAKEQEISAEQTTINGINAQMSTLISSIQNIQSQCRFDSYFTSSELIQLDRYIKDGEVSESSFVATTASTYGKEGNGGSLTGASFSVSGASIEKTTETYSTLYDIRDGTITVGGVSATIISGVVEKKTANGFVATAYLHKGTYNNEEIPGGCVSISGTYSAFTDNAGSGSISATVTGYMYFTYDASEYEQRSIAWELYDYGLTVLSRMAQPSYTFSITCANFLALSDFEAFKNHITLGERAYVSLKDGQVIEPICIGVHFSSGDLKTLEITFSDTFTATDSAFRLVDLLDKSVSMGKNLSLSRYVYSAFLDTGASNSIQEFMKSALDTAKNAIMSSNGQAISWDGAGLRLRKYANQAQTAFDDEQIWINNNSIMMTNDGWGSAKMAIGKFHDDTLGDVWGVIAPMLVGTVLAGNNLRIESSKTSENIAGTEISVFTVDANGCKLFNSDLEVSKTVSGVTTHVILSPTDGIVIGKSTADYVDPTTGSTVHGNKLYTFDNNGNRVIDYSDTTKVAKLWADADGNLHLRGTLHGVDGVFSGELSAVTGSIGGWTLASKKLYSGSGYSYVALDADTGDDYAIWAGHTTAGSAPFRVMRNGKVYATDGEFTGKITATSGTFAGNLSAATGTFAGRLVAATGTFAGSLSAATGTFSGSLSAATGTFAGSLSAATGTFAGSLSAATGSFSGTVTASAGNIGGWTIADSMIFSSKSADTYSQSDVSASYVALNAKPTDTYAIWAGNTMASSAPFRVSRAGVLTATGATISGTITALSGKIGGFQISSNYIGDAEADGIYMRKTVTTGGVTLPGGIVVAPQSGTTTAFSAFRNGEVHANIFHARELSVYNSTYGDFVDVSSITKGWLKDASVSGSTLTLTKSDGTSVSFTASGGSSNVYADSLSIYDSSYSSYINVSSITKGWIKNASVSGNTLTLTKSNGGTVTFTPSGGSSSSVFYAHPDTTVDGAPTYCVYNATYNRFSVYFGSYYITIQG